MTKAKAATKADIDPRSIAADFFRRLGGMDGMTQWGKTHRSLAYQLISKLMAQPVTNFTSIKNTVNVDGEHARRQLETALMRVISARKHDGDPAVYVDGERLIEHQPATRDTPPQAADPAPDSNYEMASSPKKGTVFSRGGVESTAAAGPKNKMSYSTVPGLAAGTALDENADDKLSTTERFLNWRGHGGPP